MAETFETCHGLDPVNDGVKFEGFVPISHIRYNPDGSSPNTAIRCIPGQLESSASLLLPGNVVRTNARAADNCNRDIVDKPTKVADCNSYFLITVTPTASTATSTSTVTPYSVLGNDAYFGTLKKRSPASTPIPVIPTNIPAYGTPLSRSDRHSPSCAQLLGTLVRLVVAVNITSVVTKTKTVTGSSFKIAATAAVLSPTKQIVVSDDRTTSPNLFGILVMPKEIVAGNEVWRLSTGYRQDYKTRFMQQDAGQAG
ncbi:uncharacterized protein PAC_05847 [Phialocephala subalpina]|uniref:Uncharacterized protein n=1 Tax=Phialocephala subalpina TaxID=576137 RepID=A0A1L7WT66_9HELO|nr:uncharacterized protein PAC_05847 [Phialocephala subalpina]